MINPTLQPVLPDQSSPHHLKMDGFADKEAAHPTVDCPKKAAPLNRSHLLIPVMSTIRNPGFWFLIGGLEVLFLVHIAEFLYPGYSVSQNYISDLGVGPSPSIEIFTFATILFGLMMAIGAFLLRVIYKRSLLWPMVLVSGIGAVGVGIFNEHTADIHATFALLAFVLGNLAAAYSYTVVRRPFAVVFVILGIIGIVALILLISSNDLGIGTGGMERMVFYPGVFWAIAFGAFLLTIDRPIGQ
jgi:hypothetical membrane protein